MENETDIIKKYVKNLPVGMREYLAKNTWLGKLSLIVQMNKLSEDQSSDLKTEVMLVLLGIENYTDLAENINKAVMGISQENVKTLSDDIEKNIFAEIKPFLEEIQKINNESEHESDDNLNAEKVLSGIENPVPAKPIVPFKSNPAGTNPILDAQHNLPEGEKKVMISSAAVPSRGPILNTFKSNYGPGPTTPNTPATPNPKPIPPTPTSAPAKYAVDPYREPPK